MRLKISDLAVCIALSCCAFLAAAARVDPSRLVVGIPDGMPGYERLPNGGLAMSDPFKQRLTDCVAKELNVRFEWKASPTKRVMQWLMSNEVDLIYPMGLTKERAAQMLQSKPVWENPDFVVSLRPVDLANKQLRLAARLGSPQQTDYASDGYVQLTGAYTYEELPRLLALQAADAVIVPKSVYLEMKEQWPAGVRAMAGRKRSTGFYVNASDPKRLLARLNAAIGRCKTLLAGQ